MATPSKMPIGIKNPTSFPTPPGKPPIHVIPNDSPVTVTPSKPPKGK